MWGYWYIVSMPITHLILYTVFLIAAAALTGKVVRIAMDRLYFHTRDMPMTIAVTILLILVLAGGLAYLGVSVLRGF